MNEKKNFYITTTLPYVNGEPHIGFAMEIVRADVVARWKRLCHFNVFFNTGTDEHGQKIFEGAKKASVDTQSFVDNQAKSFKNLIPLLGISDVHFIRTTDEKHVRAAQEFWKRCEQSGDIYKKNYTVKYCVGCELEKTDSEIENGRCMIHPHLELEIREEENYFFKFSNYQQKLLDLYKNKGNFVIPAFRFNEIKAFVERGLDDFSISRLKEKMSWGVPVPGDENHVMYVWFDALVSYISTLDWPETGNFEDFWVSGNPTQYAGKDNLRQQSAMWQAMLMSAGLPSSHQVVINGFINGAGGIKMSKSLGNSISPEEAVEKYGKDALRYFLVRELSTFEDSDFTWERFADAYNGSLANGLGNLVSRIMKMATTYGVEMSSQEVRYALMDSTAPNWYFKAFDDFELKRCIDHIWEMIAETDSIIQKSEPFKLIKTDEDAAKKIVQNLMDRLWLIASYLQPFMPDTAEEILNATKENRLPASLFPRKDSPTSSL